MIFWDREREEICNARKLMCLHERSLGDIKEMPKIKPVLLNIKHSKLTWLHYSRDFYFYILLILEEWISFSISQHKCLYSIISLNILHIQCSELAHCSSEHGLLLDPLLKLGRVGESTPGKK